MTHPAVLVFLLSLASLGVFGSGFIFGVVVGAKVAARSVSESLGDLVESAKKAGRQEERMANEGRNP